MRRSESINEIATALSKVQGVMLGAAKNRVNPAFRAGYADLKSIWTACREPMANNGLSVAQGTIVDGDEILMTTLLMHTSGQWIEGTYPLRPMKADPQGYGSAYSYARRYSLAAMLGIYVEDEDDDGEAAMDRNRDRDRGQSRQQQGRGDDHRQQRRDDRPQQQRTARQDEAPARETWSQWIGPVVTRANQGWRNEMAREGVEDRYQGEYKDLTMEPREVQYLCSLMVEAGRLSEDVIAKDNRPGVRDPAKCRAVIAERFERHPERIKAAVDEHLKHKRIELRAKLGMPDLEGDDDDSPPGVGGYDGSEIASGTPPPLSHPVATQDSQPR